METSYLHPITLAFKSRNLEKRYWKDYLPRMRRRTAVAILTVLGLYSIFGFLDPWIVPEAVREVWTIRIVMFFYSLIVIFSTRTQLFEQAHQPIIASIPIFGGIGILLMIAMIGDTGRQLYYAGLILAIIWTMLFSDLRFIIALPISIGFIVGYEFIVLVYKPVAIPIVINNSFFLFGTLIMCSFAGYIIERYNRTGFYQALVIEHERERAERLLLSILPKEVTEVLKERPGTIADRYENASILFADIVSFTTLSVQMTPEEMVELLNETFSYFDSLVDKYGLEKIRTIGDNYMVASGVPRPQREHAKILARMALEILEFTNGSNANGKKRFQFRIGMNSGPVVAGVIGSKKFQYDIWGDTVNTASRMESQGLPGKIQVSQSTYELLKDGFICEPRGPLQVKGIGMMDTWFLVSERQDQPTGVNRKHIDQPQEVSYNFNI